MLSFPEFYYKKAKPVSNVWNKVSIFVKIFWWHEILSDFRENIFANICIRREQMREAVWKYLQFFPKNLIIFAYIKLNNDFAKTKFSALTAKDSFEKS